MIRDFLRRQTNYRICGSIAWKTRNKRMRLFNEFFKDFVLCDKGGYVDETIRILDVGGVPEYWEYMDFIYLGKSKITSINVKNYDIPKRLNYIVNSVIGTAIDMRDFDDKEFDLAFSNSVIEHVGGFDCQKKMANEMLRVARHGFLQTPNRYFFMEPHFLFPFFQFLPQFVRTEIVYRFDTGHYKKAESRSEAKQLVGSINLLSGRQLRFLFPRAEIKKKKWFGMTKSYIVKW